MRRIGLVKGLFLAWTMAFGANGAAQAAEPVRWVVFYGAEAPLSEFQPYEMVILDDQTKVPIQALKDRGKTVLGYLSLGEVEQHRPWFSAVKAQNLLMQENKNWPGSFFVDVRNPAWAERVLEELVPGILARGFDGVFLDTLDNPEYLEQVDPVRYRGMQEASARLVLALRRHFPQMKIAVNRAYGILPRVARSIDVVMGESVFADYDFEQKTYGRVNPDGYRWQVERLKQARALNPRLRVISLDYWNPDDAAGIAAIYKEQRGNGFSPYVATIELNRIIPEPGAK